MEYRNMPGTDLNVSTVCLGTMTFGTPVGEKDAVRLVNTALDRGINFIDTANMYEGYSRVPGSSGGVAEEILGKALKGTRSRVVLATKVGMKVGSEPEDEFTSPAAIRKHLDRSLKKLGVDTIDLYYLHKYDPVSPLEEILHALDHVIRQGKIRYYGVSNYSAEQLSKLIETADKFKLPRPVVCQPPLSLLKQDALADIIPVCVREGISAVPYQILQGGLLTGKYKKGKPAPQGSRMDEKPDWVWDMTEQVCDMLERIEREASNTGLTMTQYAIRWALSCPGVVSAIVGVKREEQINEAVIAAAGI